MTKMTKTMLASAVALTLTAGTALAQGGGYYSFGPGASDYSNVVPVPEQMKVVGTHPNAIQSAPTFDWVDQHAETDGPIFGGHAAQAYVAQTHAGGHDLVSELADAR